MEAKTICECINTLEKMPKNTHYSGSYYLDNIYRLQPGPPSGNCPDGTNFQTAYTDKAYMAYDLEYILTDQADRQLWICILTFHIPQHLMTMDIYEHIKYLAEMFGMISPNGHISFSDSGCPYVNYIIYSQFFIDSSKESYLKPYFNCLILPTPEMYELNMSIIVQNRNPD